MYQRVLGVSRQHLQREEIGILIHARRHDVLQLLRRVIDPVKWLETAVAVLVAKDG